MVPGCRHGRGRSGRAGRHSEQEDAHCPGPRCNLGGLPGRLRQQLGRSTFDGPSGTSTVRGSVAGVALTALVAQPDRVARPSGYATTTNLTGSVGKALTSPVGAFDLDSGYLFRQGPSREPIRARAFEGGPSRTSSEASATLPMYPEPSEPLRSLCLQTSRWIIPDLSLEQSVATGITSR
jgi:hypothetical protein